MRTPHGKLIDLLAIDAEGNLHVLELKRDKTPRDVVAQVLDYGSWVTTLTREQVIDLASGHLGVPFEAAFEDVFGAAPPDELNAELELTIVATDLDASSERIVTYLRGFGVPINAVFFSYLEDDDRRYLARSWLATSEEGASGSAARDEEGQACGLERPRLVRLVRRWRQQVVGGRPDLRIRVRRWGCVVLPHPPIPAGRRSGQRAHSWARLRRGRRDAG